MPDLLTCLTIGAKLLMLLWAIDSWLAVALMMRFRARKLAGIEAFGATLGTALFIGLMGWLD